MSVDLEQLIERILAGQPTEADLQSLVSALQARQVVLATEERAIAIGGNVNDSVNITGDNNQVIVLKGTQAEEIAQFVKQRSSEQVVSIDELVQKVRSRLHDDIQRLHGTMPLWGIDHWVPLGDLFVDVNVLEELSSSGKAELNDLWQDFTAGTRRYSSYRSLDRIGIGKERQRVSGLEVLAKTSNLMVVGKPGSGKTTYLQRIVTECNAGRLRSHQIPVLIKLREFVEDGRSVEYCLNRHLSNAWHVSEAETEHLLQQGKALVLLDGLDEVTGDAGRSITKAIKHFARSYPQNQLIITCRTQSQESRFERFDYVEVADFNEKQVKAFAEHWFKAVMNNKSAGSVKARSFLRQLFSEQNKPIRELAITPILLSLTCAVFHQTGKFYSKQSKLYEEGLELLLEKWDKSREIERDEIYRDLSIDRKQKLLSYLAVKKFEQPQYILFEQEELEDYIAEFLEIGKRESRAVLKSIESQHGLLIERSQQIWSFSHLTFQEYFVSRWSSEGANWQDLSEKIVYKHWKEVFLLLIGVSKNADELLLSMKQWVDNIPAMDISLQNFLEWINQKSLSISTSEKIPALRAAYFTLAFSLNIGDCDTDLVRIFDSEIRSIIRLQQNITIYDGRLASSQANEPISITTLKYAIELDYFLARDLILAATFNQKASPQLHRHLQQIRNLLPDLQVHSRGFQEWWRVHGKVWTERLRAVLVQYRNIGHDWGFNDNQKGLLQQYLDSNKLLMDCLNSDSSVSSSTRQEIEKTLLLPIAEIEKLKRDQQGKKTTKSVI